MKSFSLPTRFYHGVLMRKVYFPVPWPWAPLYALQARRHDLEVCQECLDGAFLLAFAAISRSIYTHLLAHSYLGYRTASGSTWGRCPSQSDSQLEWSGQVQPSLGQPTPRSPVDPCGSRPLFQALHFLAGSYIAVAYWLKGILHYSPESYLPCSALVSSQLRNQHDLLK